MAPKQASRAPAHGNTLPKMLYIGGIGRNGSTLVGRVLGEAPGVLCVGETRYLRTRGLIDNVECGCGQPFRSCPFWGTVGEEAFGGWSRVNTERFAEVDRAANRLRALPRYWMQSLRSDSAGTVSYDYISWFSRLYSAIARVSGAKMIVETSKEPNFAWFLGQMPGNHMRILHLVRDSRAVAYSWTRNKRLPSPIGEQKFMPQFSPAETAIRWLTSNAAFHTISTSCSRYTRVSYESFIADPQKTLHKLSDYAEDSVVLPAPQLEGKKVKLEGHHIFSGNPMRANTGWIEMRLDDEWQTMLPTPQFAEVTAITYPLLRLYGYPVIPTARRDAVPSLFTLW